MTTTGWVSIVALLGWLALSVSALRSYRLGTRKALTMALTWLAVFALVTAIFAGLTR